MKLKSYEFDFEVTEKKSNHIYSSDYCVLAFSLPKAVYMFLDYIDNCDIKIFRILDIKVNGKNYSSDCSYCNKVINKAFIKWAKENR